MPEPLHLEILAATLPEHDVRIFDMRIEANLIDMLDKFQPDVVGVTALTTEVYTARETLMMVKKYSCLLYTSPSPRD